MNNEMRPVPFGTELKNLLAEYCTKGTLEQVPVWKGPVSDRIGVAAGPHTQTCQGIVACWAAGAGLIELKTIQTLYGKDLGIRKPCIDSGDEVYNTEWSSEFSAGTAAGEYIRAFLLIRLLSKELSIPRIPHFAASVGYDYKGITSPVVTGFIRTLQDASGNPEWQEDLAFVRANRDLFANLTDGDVQDIVDHPCIAPVVTLSTMHGCPGSEIRDIVYYLLDTIGSDTRVKLNPTLVGFSLADKLLKTRDFRDELSPSLFEKDPDIKAVQDIITDCLEKARECGHTFGVKLTNTLPVHAPGSDDSAARYLSGKALYPLSVQTAALVASRCPDVPVSFSGGADSVNTPELLRAGIRNVTICSLLLSPGGYRNLSRVQAAAAEAGTGEEGGTDLDALMKLSAEASCSRRWRASLAAKPAVLHHPEIPAKTCAFCHSCVDVCPNRANVRLRTPSGEAVLHVPERCNACGVCACTCPLGRIPYEEKGTIDDIPTD